MWSIISSSLYISKTFFRILAVINNPFFFFLSISFPFTAPVLSGHFWNLFNNISRAHTTRGIVSAFLSPHLTSLLSHVSNLDDFLSSTFLSHLLLLRSMVDSVTEVIIIAIIIIDIRIIVVDIMVVIIIHTHTHTHKCLKHSNFTFREYEK